MHSYSTSIRRIQTLAQEKDIAEHEYVGKHNQQGAQEAQTHTIRILLVDDHALMREGLRHLCSQQAGFEVVGEAMESATAMRLVERFQPDVVLVDIHQSTVDAIALTRRITQTFPAIVVILLSIQRGQQYITQAFKSGARGYLHNSASFVEVARAIRIVRDGGTYVAQELASTFASGLHPVYTQSSADELQKRRREPQIVDVLTEKEIEIVRHVATGMSNKEIAHKLAYSEKTVKNYLSTIFQKLNIRDRTQAAILALKQGILDM